MEPAKAKGLNDEELIDVLSRAAYISFSKNDILALEELIRRYKRAISRGTPE